MTNNFCAVAAAVFALLNLTAPAQATTIQWDLTNVVVASDPTITLTGYFDYDTVANSAPNTESPNYNITVYESSLPLGNCLPTGGCAMNFETTNSVVGGSGEGTPTGNFLLVGADPFDGTVSVITLASSSEFWFVAPDGMPFTGSLTEVSSVPLPAALPLFGCAVLGLVVAASRRKIFASSGHDFTSGISSTTECQIA
jgi:hypothetical protein